MSKITPAFRHHHVERSKGRLRYPRRKNVDYDLEEESVPNPNDLPNTCLDTVVDWYHYIGQYYPDDGPCPSVKWTLHLEDSREAVDGDTVELGVDDWEDQVLFGEVYMAVTWMPRYYYISVCPGLLPADPEKNYVLSLFTPVPMLVLVHPESWLGKLVAMDAGNAIVPRVEGRSSLRVRWICTGCDAPLPDGTQLSLSAERSCMICLDSYEPTIAASCHEQHRFCVDCYDSIYKSSGVCPMCKAIW